MAVWATVSKALRKSTKHANNFSFLWRYLSIRVLRIYPGNWSRGYISSIFKSGDRSKPDNYRGIAITGCLSKLLSSILNSRLDIFLIKHKLINPFQIGFTKDSRPSDHMFVLVKGNLEDHL
jgi:hypothetical protein